jgi:hypothetical protein
MSRYCLDVWAFWLVEHLVQKEITHERTDAGLS